MSKLPSVIRKHWKAGRKARIGGEGCLNIN
jgi:hypothetical protein